MIDPADITPTLDRVGRIILPRTRENRLAGGSGRPAGTFTEHTVPTEDIAQQYVDDAAREVAMLLGVPGTTWTGDLEGNAKDVAATLAALNIERAYGSDGTTDSDVVESLQARWASQSSALIATAKNNQTGGWRMSSIRMVTSESVLEDELDELEDLQP